MGTADSDGKLSQILIHTSELQTKIGDLGSDVTSLKSSMEFIVNTTVEELKSNIENKVGKQVFEVYKKDTTQKIDDLEKRFGDYKAEALNFPDSNWSEWERMHDKVRQSATFRYVQQRQVNYVAKLGMKARPDVFYDLNNTFKYFVCLKKRVSQ